MKLQVKREWIKALRSGKFKQGTGLLHNSTDNTYCCLGVLARIQGKGKKWLADHCTDTEAEYASPQDKWPKEWPASKDTDKLVGMNDGGLSGASNRKSFKQIAAYLQRRKKI